MEHKINTIVKSLMAAIFSCASLSAAAEKSHPSLLIPGVGIFDVDKSNPRALFQLEYRPSVNVKNIHPLVGVMSTQDGTTYVYGGAAWDIFISKRFVITPTFAPGIYFRNGGKDLGFPLEFRSSLEIAWIASNKSRLGAQFYHISNASLGYKNPGVECLVFFYSIPLP